MSVLNRNVPSIALFWLVTVVPEKVIVPVPCVKVVTLSKPSGVVEDVNPAPTLIV